MAAVMDASAWLSALQALLPPGAALPREPGARFTALLQAFATQLSGAQALAQGLRDQSSDPRLASDMLPDWERLLGLPDDCMANADLSVADRQRLAFLRLTELGGQSRAHFVALAEAYGEPGVSIDEFRPMTCTDDCNDALHSAFDRFTWRVNVPRGATSLRAMTCNDDCRDALLQYSPSLIECPIRERRPAHTTVIFAYQT